MGQFSWMYADTHNSKQMLDNVCKESFLLVPEEFQEKYGPFCREYCYDGYGHFGPYDVYDLIPEWNRDFIPVVVANIQAGTWKCSANEKDINELMEYHRTGVYSGTNELRWLGIIMSCYDEDNRRLKYPIKITTKPMDYESVEPSESDPNQGWSSEDEDDEEDY